MAHGATRGRRSGEHDPRHRRPAVCVFAGDGEDALRMVRDGRPDLVLIDVEMPRRSGLEVLAALRQDAETRATRVILTCAGAWLAPR